MPPWTRRELDRHCRRVWLGALGGDRGRALASAAAGPTCSPNAAWCGTKSARSPLPQAESICRECEASLKRLKMDYVDLYQIHWPIPDKDIEEGWARWRSSSKRQVRHIGVSNSEWRRCAGKEDRADNVAAAAVFARAPRNRKRCLAHDCQGEYRSAGILAHASGLLSGTMTRERVAAMPATIGED